MTLSILAGFSRGRLAWESCYGARASGRSPWDGSRNPSFGSSALQTASSKLCRADVRLYAVVPTNLTRGRLQVELHHSFVHRFYGCDDSCGRDAAPTLVKCGAALGAGEAEN